jgi:flagellar motor switch protein FliN/FliY
MTNEMTNPDGAQGKSRGNQTSAKEVTFADIEPGSMEGGSQQNLDFLLDIPLEISVELGRTKVTVGDLLKLSQGSVVELERSTDQPLEIYVNRKLMAQGEVVVVNEKFGIRLTNIISQGDRVKTLT